MNIALIFLGISIIFILLCFGVTIFKLGKQLDKEGLKDIATGVQTPLLALALMAIFWKGSSAYDNAKSLNINLFWYRLIWGLIPFLIIGNAYFLLYSLK
jgi:hypothetical protein